MNKLKIQKATYSILDGYFIIEWNEEEKFYSITHSNGAFKFPFNRRDDFQNGYHIVDEKRALRFEDVERILSKVSYAMLKESGENPYPSFKFEWKSEWEVK